MRLSANPWSSRYRKRGAILLFALWSLVVLVIMALGISNRVAAEMSFTKFLDNRVISLYLAKAALNRSVLELAGDKTPGCDDSSELRKERVIDFGSGQVAYYFLDEERLMNINAVSQEVIARLPGLTPDLAQDIFTSGLKPFLLKEQLLLIPAVTPEIYAQFKDLVTVYGSGNVNVNTAEASIMRLLGLSDETIDLVMNYRRGDDGTEGTQDDGVYTSVPSQIPDTLKNLFGVGSSDLKLDVTTKVLGRPQAHYSIVVSRSSGKVKLWQEK